MQSLSRILVAVDLHHGDRLADDELSTETAAAVREAIELAGRANAVLTFCSVLEISEQAQELIRDDKENIFATVEDYAQKIVERLAEQTRARGISAAGLVRIGSTWEQLLKQISEGRHDLVIVGTRKRSGMARTIFGSTAQRLLRTAPCPVWIVKPEEMRDLREILVATDLSDVSQEVLNSGVYVARLLNAKLFVVHSLEFPFEAYMRTAGLTEEEVVKHRTRLRQEAQTKLDAQLVKSDARTLPHGIKAVILEGSPDDVVTKFIVENEIDLLILGSQGHTGLSRVLLGNTAERILPNVNASVLTVRIT